MEQRETHLRYLMTIYELGQTAPEVGAAAVARALNVSRPSVTRMLGVLMDKGLVVRERYGKIYLTDRGFLLARNFQKKVHTLQRLIPAMNLCLTGEELLETACLLAAALPQHVFDGWEPLAAHLDASGNLQGERD